VAEGLDAWITAPEPGDHRVTLVVRGRGGPAKVESTLRTLDPAEADPGHRGGTPDRVDSERRGRSGAKRGRGRRR
jgi:hypothetical protein